MTSPHDEPTLDDVIDPTESAPRDRQEHGGAPDRIDDEVLEHRAEHERAQVAGEDLPASDRPTAED